ncbi:pyridoxine 5'-phosphate synthase [Helicobacter sp. 13S00401-1]|uniref:pyridoxine 5'-phosphate synthase n=1 Tax=Helicobacter sp. 13S00401-1 TaxID=1905758 RepID=UPI000BA7AA5A|nr:pyridoxine 5'-phosphate synthase [Helicobacter sp. 13S00401-1]PAF50789.1 pyridoxine 5'-phosphate synthase [Helicobacter sp. 13S00401-1]
MRLGINIDHIATLREARKTNQPDPLEAVFICEKAGANQITMHLREDRRHMHDFDLRRIIESSFLPINLECALDKSILDMACKLLPARITLVPEKREEVTTEGGLKLDSRLKEPIKRLKDSGIEVSLFIDPSLEAIRKAKELESNAIELHTGRYANLSLELFTNLKRTNNALNLNATKKEFESELSLLKEASKESLKLGLKVYAGHGLNYQNTQAIVDIPQIEELNIGHSIIARAVFVGLERAIREMKEICKSDGRF